MMFRIARVIKAAPRGVLGRPCFMSLEALKQCTQTSLKAADESRRSGKLNQAQRGYEAIISADPDCKQAYEKLWDLWQEDCEFRIERSKLFDLNHAYLTRFGQDLPYMDFLRDIAELTTPASP